MVRSGATNGWGAKKLVLLGLFSLAVVFAYFKTHDLLFGKDIVIESPINGQTLKEPFVTIKGRAPGSTLLTVGGAKVIPDQDGKFIKETILGIGYNVIDVVSVDRFNRESSEILELIYRPLASTSDGNDSVAFMNL